MVTKNGELTTEVVDVTPELAAKWLETMVDNRKLTSSVVEKYKDSMLGGFWKLDASPIRFNTKDQLMDGQHRLWAVIESGKPQKFLIVRGVVDDAFLTMDSGKKRGFADVLSIEFPDLKDVLSTAAATRAIYRLELGAPLKTMIGNRGGEIPNASLLEFFRQHQDSIIAASKAANAIYQRFPGVIQESLWSAIVWTFHTLSLEDANAFLASLKDGRNLEDTSPIWHLRNILTEQLTRRSRPRLEVVALVLKAWNMFREGTEVQRLLVKLGGANPEAYPVPR